MAKVEQKDLIIAYRNKGLSYSEIAEKLDVSVDYARTVCSRKPRARNKGPTDSENICVYCGKELDLSGNRRERLFCDDRCRKKYYNQANMRTPFICTCHQCGHEFVAYGFADKKYCSRECRSLARRNHEQRS